jgi:DNA-binding NarL/FixJ family response regulator
MKKIAIVDDHTMFRKGLAALIEQFGQYEITIDASNGKDLIAQVEKAGAPDIVLLDISMLEMNGFETAAWLRDNYPDVMILALSTIDAEMAIIQMIRRGARGYILKDANPEDLRRALSELTIQGYYYNDLITRQVMRSISHLGENDEEIKAFHKITDREMEFLRLACSEKAYKEIAKEMYLSERTIDGYRDSLFKKLNITSRVGLVMYAIRNHIVKI